MSPVEVEDVPCVVPCGGLGCPLWRQGVYPVEVEDVPFESIHACKYKLSMLFMDCAHFF